MSRTTQEAIGNFGIQERDERLDTMAYVRTSRGMITLQLHADFRHLRYADGSKYFRQTGVDASPIRGIGNQAARDVRNVGECAQSILTAREIAGAEDAFGLEIFTRLGNRSAG